VAVASAGPYTVCKFAPRSRQITTRAPTTQFLQFTDRMPFLPPNQQRQSTEGTVSLRKCPYDHGFTNTAYLSAITVTNVSQSFTNQMAAKINWHRYGAKLCYCHPMYSSRHSSRRFIMKNFIKPSSAMSINKIVKTNTRCIDILLTMFRPNSQISEYGQYVFSAVKYDVLVWLPHGIADHNIFIFRNKQMTYRG